VVQEMLFKSVHFQGLTGSKPTVQGRGGGGAEVCQEGCRARSRGSLEDLTGQRCYQEARTLWGLLGH
jgi:hypothetical protein